jgi:hypothetical protein
MNARYLLGLALVAAASLAACSSADDPDALGGGDVARGRQSGQTGDDADGTAQAPGTPGAPGSSAPTPTNSPAGKAFFTANVFPFLQTACAGCHTDKGPGTQWMASGDADKTYAMVFQLGYVSVESRILKKGAHGGSTTNVLTTAQSSTFIQWVNMELKDGGTKAPPNVLEKIADCLDQAKFDAIGLANMRTIQRTTGNNANQVQGWAENADRCTGCDNATCRNCHTADPGSNFVLAYGYPGLPADYTFQQSKLTNPAYLQHYIGVDATGNPIGSNALQNKALATGKDKAYTHPYFKLSATQLTAIQAFVDDAATKYKAGTCGK